MIPSIDCTMSTELFQRSKVINSVTVLVISIYVKVWGPKTLEK